MEIKKSIQALFDSRRKEINICMVILLAGSLLKLLYAIRVPYNISPHDLGQISNWEQFGYGHLSYIQYVYKYRALIMQNPVTAGQFYHPPLFHIVGAIIFLLFYRPGVNIGSIFEIVQLVNTLFACCTVYVGYRILTHLEVTGKKLITLTAFLSFGPSLYWIGTEINNDCLMTLLQVITVEQLILWIKKPRTSTIVKLAVALALTMLTKTSGVLVAVAIACVFLYQLICRIKKKEKVVELIKQFAIFGVVSVPLGMSYVLRNWILFRTPMQYVPNHGTASPYYIGDCSLWQRLGLPSLTQILSVRIQWDRPKEYSNVWGQILLTMGLDEGILSLESRFAVWMGRLLIWSCAAATLLLLYRTILALFQRTSLPEYKLLVSAGFVALLASFVVFAFQYAHPWTMNFRYIYTALFFLVMGCGLCNKEMHLLEKGVLWGHCVLATAAYLLFP
ncbi:MAG: glycosyltransferase family 39 protein [Oscillospiraceae bacterium]|nr:glycosyltransferase family 39 protein [Oscillospiraceae bacterium]